MGGKTYHAIWGGNIQEKRALQNHSCRPSKVVWSVPTSSKGIIWCRQIQGKQRHINIHKFEGLSVVWVGGKILFLCVLGVIPDRGEKAHK